MRNDSTTAVPSHSLGSTTLALAGIAALILFLLAVVSVLIFCLPAIVHLVVE